MYKMGLKSDEVMYKVGACLLDGSILCPNT